MKLSHLPIRLVTGAFIAHSGWEKWQADEATAEGMHAMASNAYPVVKDMAPTKFLRLLAGGEMGLGAALLAPVVPAATAGAALTAFSGALMGLYARTPGMRQPGSIWPTPDGIGLSKDVWLMGAGLSMLADGRSDRRGSRTE